jgi:hypothetical protein
MMHKTSPKLGSFDVLEIMPRGNFPMLLPGVLPGNDKFFCTQSEATALMGAMSGLLNAPGNGGNATLTVVLDTEPDTEFVFMKADAPNVYDVTGTYSVDQKTFSVGETAGELLDRQTTPLTGIDHTPYADPKNPKLAFSLVADAVRFFWE